MNTKILSLLAFGLLFAGFQSSRAAVLITQYYEGPSTNKWIEITNTGTTSVDLGALNYKLSLWTNANAEAYKSNGSPSQTMTLSGTLAVGASYLYGNTGNTTPTYATATATNNSVINFNGNDSITLWAGSTFTTVSIVDAIGFTNSGNEGADKSFVRLTTAPGWDTVAGSNVTNFSSIWSQVTLAAVDDAAAETEARLGYSAVPEPAAALLGSLGMLALLRRRR